MKTVKILASSIIAVQVGIASAAVSSDEARLLGATLTMVGAVKAGNQDSTIPPYAGGLTKPPANYAKKGVYVDPFADEKPLYRIDASNWKKYEDRLTPGAIALIAKYPKTFFIDVYRTHRTAAYPAAVLEQTVRNATRCSLINEGTGVDTSNGCGGGFPFPIPKNGTEALWNLMMSPLGPGVLKTDVFEYIKSDGEIVNTGTAAHLRAHPISDPNTQFTDPPLLFQRLEYDSPARLVGDVKIFSDSVKDSSRLAYAYLAATRRVRLAPDLAADAPITATGGVQLYDDDSLFNGTPERFEWTLVGKEERYIPYNNNRMSFPTEGNGCTPKEYETAHHWKSACMRWELHRVWHIVGKLKEGKRHVYSKREIFLDEDAMSGGISENYDHSGKLYKLAILPIVQMHDVPMPVALDTIFLDLTTGIWIVNRTPQGGIWSILPATPSMQTPDSAKRFVLKK